MQRTLKIQRFNPETDRKPHWEEYAVEVEPTDRLLDALNQVKGTRTARWLTGAPARTASAGRTR